MALERFLDPLSEDEPCGPDLYDAYDPEFETYYDSAMSRLPERYFTQGGEGSFASGSNLVPFDRSNIDLKKERANVEKLLDRSRDLRLVVLLAQFAALSGNLELLADCAELTAGLLERYWDHVHPRVHEDNIERTNALELLDTPATVVMPLEFAPLANDRRLKALTFRRYAVSSGRRNKIGAETEEDAAAIVAALRNLENGPQVEASFNALSRLRTAIKTIENTCMVAETGAFRPNLSAVSPQVDAMLELLIEARQDFGESDAVAEDTPDEAVDEAAETPDDGAPVAAAAAPAVSVGDIATMAEARAALGAIETYFNRYEPSSPALLLIRQSRLLVGQPLVRALEILLPEQAGNARIDFNAGEGFLLAMDRMRELTSEGEDPSDPAPEPDPITTRAEATAQITAVENYYRRAEPSSPIPILLFKAKGYLNRDFTAILSDLFPVTD